MANQWLRLWHDMPTDPKWRTIARASGQKLALVTSVYVHLLVSASANDTERGVTQANAEDIASALDEETQSVEAVLAAMEGRVIENGKLSGWERRQPQREDSTAAERAKAYRERNRTQPNAPSRKITLDKEEIREEEKEQKQAAAAQSAFVLPDWIDSETWHGFEEMRKKQRKPLTAKARALAISKLETYRRQGHAPESVLNNSILNGYQGLFPPSASDRAAKAPTPQRIYVNRPRPEQVQ